MKRPGFKRFTYEEALAKKRLKQSIALLGLHNKNTLERKSEQPEHKHIGNAAAKPGERRRKQRKAAKLKKEAEFKSAVRIRDNFTCRWPLCSYSGLHIDVHHVNEKSQRPDSRYDPENGVCICREHHDYAHHTVQGRMESRVLGLLGGETYEAAKKRETGNSST